MNRLSAVTASSVLCGLHKVGLPRDRLSRLRRLIYRKVLRRPERTFHTRLADYAEHRIEKSISNFLFILDGKNPGKTLVEFGTGAMGSDLVLAFLLGYEKIITCDINDHLEFENFFKIAQKAADRVGDIAEQFGLPTAEVEARSALLCAADDKEDLYRRRIITFLPLSQLLATPLSNVDLWYSESTLQRVPLSKFEHLARHVAGSLSPDALVFHKLDIADIYTQPHYPFYIPSAHRFDFLKYPEWLWKIMNNDLYSSQNRLRVPQYLELFNKLGLHLRRARFVRYAGDEDYLRGMRLAKPFARHSLHEQSVAHAKLLMTPAQEDNPQIEDFEVAEGGDFLDLDW